MRDKVTHPVKPCHSLQRSRQLRYEMVAHSRWLSAMDIHPSKDTIVTAAQDCTVGVWQLPIAGAKVRTRDSQEQWQQLCDFGACTVGNHAHHCPIGLLPQAACLLSACSLHDVLTGVTFCGPDNNDVAAVSYDADALLVWQAGSSR